MMEVSWIGVDGGGTKTRFVTFDKDMQQIDTIDLGTCHFAQVGYDGMEEVLTEGLSKLLPSEGKVGIGFGLCGYGEDPEVRSCIEAVVARVAGPLSYALINDVEAAHAGALELKDGIVVIAGTGSIAYARKGDVADRCGGWGYQIGDEGSGYWLGREALRLFSREADGREEKGPLYDLMCESLGLEHAVDVIGFVRNHIGSNRTEMARLSRILSEAALRGDKSAHAAFQMAAGELADLVGALNRRVFMCDGEPYAEVPVACAGGVFAVGELLREPLSDALPSNCRLVETARGPAAGACLVLRRRLEIEGDPEA